MNFPAGLLVNSSGIAARGGRYFAWADVVAGNKQVLVLAPLTRRFLSGMAPGLGDVYFLQAFEEPDTAASSQRGEGNEKKLNITIAPPTSGAVAVQDRRFAISPAGREAPGAALPAAVNPVSYTHLDVYKRQLAARLGCELHGDPELEITGVAGLEQAGPGDLTFLANPKYGAKVKNTRAAAILVKEPLPVQVAGQAPGPGPASLVSANPYHDFARALGMFYQPPRPKPGIHPQACLLYTSRCV